VTGPEAPNFASASTTGRRVWVRALEGALLRGVVIGLVLATLGHSPAVFGQDLRGDANCDGRVDPSDLVSLLGSLFNGSLCPQADVNGDGRLSAADVVAEVAEVSAHAPSPTWTPTGVSTTATPTQTTPTPTVTASPGTATVTSTATRTTTITPTLTGTLPTATRTPTASRSPSSTPTMLSSLTPTATSTGSPANTATATATPDATSTRTATSTSTATAMTNTPSPSRTSTSSPTITPNSPTVPTATPSIAGTMASTLTPTRTATRTATASPTPTQPSGEPSGPRIVAFAAVPSTGCAACTNFLCECGSLPTPTPELDAQGRRIFRSSGGRGFLLIVEAQTGPSGASPGAFEPVVCTSAQRPDLRIQSNRMLGVNPPLTCPPQPGITPGIAAFPTPDFGPSQAVTIALQDFGSRFDPLHTGASEACTKDGSGMFNFLSSPPPPTPPLPGVRQYCYLVDSSAQFPVGDTVLTAIVADSSAAKNVGPAAQIVVRVSASGLSSGVAEETDR
jgi:hypothetical protein